MTLQKYPLYLLLIAATILSSCKKDPSSGPGKKTAVDVYTGGQINDSTSLYSIATYWKNGVATPLYDSPVQSSSSINRIAVKNGDVYSVGYYWFYSNTVAALWKNKTVTPLADPTKTSQATAISLSGNDVYVAGYIADEGGRDQAAVYWKNGTITKLPDDGFGAGAYAIAVSGSDVYIAGGKILSSGYVAACYWKNGAAMELATKVPGNGIGTGIVINNSNVFITGSSIGHGAGTYYDPFVTDATYWKDGTPTVIGNGKAMSKTNGIAINGNDVYISGFTTAESGKYVATYWKNGVMKQLADGSVSSNTSDICVAGNDVYISGYKTNSSGTVATQFYWKNGIPVKIPALHAFTNCITVVPAK